MNEKNTDADAPVFSIAVAAELAGLHPQTLRQYDRLGLVIPGRTQGGSRRYSTRNIEQLRRVAELSEQGLTRPSVMRLLALESEIAQLRGQVMALQGLLRHERENRPGRWVFAAARSGTVVQMPQGTRRRERGERAELTDRRSA